MESIKDDTFSFGKVKLTKSDFPVITNLLFSTTDSLNIIEVLFDNPHHKRFLINRIDLKLNYYYDSSVNGFNDSEVPEKVFVIDNKLGINSK